MSVALFLLASTPQVAFGQESASQGTTPASDYAFGSNQESLVRVPAAMVKIANSISVPAEYAGVLTRMLVREGQLLKKGEPIAKINDSELRLRLAQAEYENQISAITAKNDVDIRFSKKSSEVAHADVLRSIESNGKVPNSIPLAKLDRQVLEKERTLLQLEQAERDHEIARLKKNLTGTQLQLSRLLLKKTEIRAPMGGMVVAVERREGEWVEPSETVIRLVKIDRLRVEGFVSAENASKIKIGFPAQVKFSQDWLKDHIYTGTVVFVDPEANPVNSQIMVWVEIENHENKLLPGLRGEILIDTRQRNNEVDTFDSTTAPAGNSPNRASVSPRDARPRQ